MGAAFGRAHRALDNMRLLALGLAIAVIVFVVSGGHILFLPLLFVPFGLFSLGHRRQRDRGTSAAAASSRSLPRKGGAA